MCENCWKEYGSPRIDTQEIREAAILIKAVYDYHPTAGNLHCQLDDWNIDDDFFRDYECYIENTSEEQREAEIKCFYALKILSEEERASALGLHDGYWEVLDSLVRR
jgi:hypothetical protein